MDKTRKIISSLTIIMSLIGAIHAAFALTVAHAPSLQPQLLALAQEYPAQQVAVIVQKADTTDQAEKLVVQFGGIITKDLHIINAFAAQLSASSAVKLAQSGIVRWVSLDAVVESTGKPVSNTGDSHQTLSDDFNEVSFENNDGTQRWASNWIEQDPSSPGPSSGNILVANGGLRLQGAANASTPPSAAREADLGHALTGPSLAFKFSFGPGVKAGTDNVLLEISADGGITYEPIITFGSYNGGTSGTFYGGLAEYTSSHTRIRFRVLSGYDSPDDYFSIDSIEIGYDANPLSSGVAYNTYLDTLNVRPVWDMGYDGTGIGVAIIDSGITKESDFERRINKQISFNSNSNTINDTYGHGTHVAGIVGGNDGVGRFMGIAPGAHLISLKISDETGMAYESDMVEAMQWVFENHSRYKIRVVNISVNSTVQSSYHTSPIDAAAEVLWFNKIVVVASAGNKGTGSGPNTTKAAPANDPFVITVGASNEFGNASRADDSVSAFSSFGTTADGHSKPDIIAPGKDIISVLSGSSTWYAAYTQRVVQEEYFRLSGTSMAAPMVTGAVALLLQAEPNLTPDQVKYRLIATSSSIPGSSSVPGEYPYLNIYAAFTTPTVESANTGIQASQLLWSGDEPVTWSSVAWNSVAWNSVAWNSVAWNSVAWNSVAWNSVAWNE